MEPVQRILPPRPGFLEGVRELTARHDVPLVFDEIVTGFRLAYGGAQAYYGVVPDVCTLGKVLGGGYPLAAIAGREDITAHFDAGRVGPDEHLLQLGTLSGNPIAARAGLATLEVLRRPGTYGGCSRPASGSCRASRSASPSTGSRRPWSVSPRGSTRSSRAARSRTTATCGGAMARRTSGSTPCSSSAGS